MKLFISRLRQRYQLRSVLSAMSMVLVGAVLTGVAIASPGFDVQQVKVNTGSVWIMQAGQGQRYGLVSTELKELSSANTIHQPSGIVQSGSGALIFASAFARYGILDASEPTEYIDDPALFKKPPVQVDDVQTDGGVVAYIANGGELWISNLFGSNVSEPQVIPAPEGAPGDLAFDAMSVTQSGLVFVFSAADGIVRAYDAVSSRWTPLADSVQDAGQGSYQVTSAGDQWALLDEDTGRVWVRGQADPVSPALDGDSRLQSASPSGEVVFVAHEGGLVSVSFDSGAVEDLVETVGVPARPVWFGNSIYAAWLGEGDSGGLLYSAATDTTSTLDYNAQALDEEPVPVIQANEYTAVVNETVSGWAWRSSDGELIPSTQDWNIVDQKTQETSDTAEETEVTAPKPPVAESDSFGVRSGQLANLPVLLNDHDPNKDIVSIDVASVQGLNPSFGTVAVADDGQSLVVQTTAGATGTASFSYRITDGTAADGLYSNVTSVQLEIASNSTDGAPRWCDEIVTGCLQDWPRAQVEPGGSVAVPVLDGWVDPEGDALFVASAELLDGSGAVGVDDNGRVVYQHGDAGLAQQAGAQIAIVVSDIRGNRTTKQLGVVVTPDPLLQMTPYVMASTVNSETRIDISHAVSGTSGELVITSAKVGEAQSSAVSLQVVGPTTMLFTSSQPGQYVVSLTASDESGELATFVRVNVVEPGNSKIATKPVTVLVAPTLDTTVDVFAATHNPDSLVLMVEEIVESKPDDASLSAELVANGLLRVRGATANTTDGLIGVVNYLVTDGRENSEHSARGQAFVYQLSSSASSAPVAVRDVVTVREGGIASVDVLSNDVGVRGVPLTIDPASLDSSCLPGGLLYLSKGLIRIVAPDAPGDYLCPYVVSNAGTPSLKGVGEILIHVGAEGTNSEPVPLDLEMRVVPGQVGELQIPLVGIDPDGDTVTLKSLSKPSEGFGFAAINEELSGVEYSALAGTRGQDEFTYTVEDAYGATATGRIRVGIVGAEAAVAPVPMVDLLDIVVGEGNKAVLDPVANDFDPLGEALTLVDGSITPNTSPGSDAYRAMEAAVSQVEGNRVTFTATDEPMLMSYLYSVTNESGNVSVGTIVVRVAQEVGVVYPDVSDTRVTLRERADLSAGIDVLTDKVSWPTGNVNELSLSLWGDTDGFSVSGRSIRGSAPDAGATVVFQVTGEDFSGQTVVSFGMLVIPSVLDIPISLDIRQATQEVLENQSVTFDVATLVSLPADVDVEINRSEVTSSGARTNASCEPAEGTSVTYSAGSGKPWTDGCVVPVRIRGTSEYTSLLVPIEVIPENPEPELSTRQVTVIPGRSYNQVFNLWQMTSWYGTDDFSSLDYSYSYTGNQFEITQDENELDIMAFGVSSPGNSEIATVSIDNHPETAPASLTLLVGESPNDGPLGGVLEKECQANDSSCVMNVSEVTGSYNPYPDQPLVFAPFNYSSGAPNYQASTNAVKCGGVTIRATPTTLNATWENSPLPESRTCDSVAYLVIDDEGRVGRGSLAFTFLGAPGAPGRATQIGFSETTITVRIEAGPSGLSDPKVTSYKLREGADVIDCEKQSPDEVITTCVIEGQEAFTGRNPAAKHNYRVFASNEIGESLSFVTLSNAYAYKSPVQITTDVFDRVLTKVDDNPTDAFGLTAVTITPIYDPTVRSYEISGLGSPDVTTRVLADFSPFTVDIRARPGVKSSITVRAIGNVGPPISTGASTTSTATWIGQVAAAPAVAEVSARLLGGNAGWGAKVTARAVNRNYSRLTSRVAFVVWKDGTAEPRCRWIASSNTLEVDPGSSPNSFVEQSTDDDFGTQISDIASRDIPGLADATRYRHKFCYSNGYGMAEKIGLDANSLTTLSDPEDGRFTYEVSATPNNNSWLVRLVSGSAPTGLTVQFNGSATDPNDWRNSIYSTSFGEPISIKVRYCMSNGTCSSGERLVQLANPNRAWQLQVTRGYLADQNGAAVACRLGENLFLGLEGRGLTSSSGKTWRGGEPGQGTSAQFLSDWGWQDMQDLGSNYRIPEDATNVTNVRFFISGNSEIEPTRGITGQATVEFAVTCN